MKCVSVGQRSHVAKSMETWDTCARAHTTEIDACIEDVYEILGTHTHTPRDKHQRGIEKRRTLINVCVHYSVDPARACVCSERVYVRSVQLWATHMDFPVIAILGKEKLATVHHTPCWGEQTGTRRFTHTHRVFNRFYCCSSRCASPFPPTVAQVLLSSIFPGQRARIRPETEPCVMTSIPGCVQENSTHIHIC